MARIDTAIKWFKDREGKVTYSMTYRNGPNSYDCSSAVYIALKSAGILPANTAIGNTDSLFGDLERAGFTQLKPDSQGNVTVQRGDVFIWGIRGNSTGSLGHTGIFIDGGANGAESIIHCNYGNNGISVNNHDSYWDASGHPQYTFYRPPADAAPAAPAQAAKPAAAPAVSAGLTEQQVYNAARRAIVDVLNGGLKK